MMMGKLMERTELLSRGQILIAETLVQEPKFGREPEKGYERDGLQGSLEKQ